ncbi:hypothetical protein SAY87_000267 [Trapa incisa]|uniref:Uncharacterized protein n=1 Tax=Trapa incisa TaxID=236973 RepID=A0AAN7J9P9_9MYRT|nr:hypothetical protein SAY87_000267 [Trapa incisa]
MENDGDGPFTPDDAFDVPMDFDFMEELFLNGCWVETTDAFEVDINLPQSGPLSTSNELINPPTHLPLFQPIFQETQKDTKIEELGGRQTQAEISDFHVEGTEGGKRLWIAPKNAETNPSAFLSVKQRLMMAIECLRECTRDKDVLIQIWVPVKKEGRQVLTTDDQPFSMGLSSKGLENYRSVSRAYEFPTDQDSKESFGLPGRVFLGKLPEWTPDVRFFRSEEYPRIDHARQCDVRGSMAVPVFEQGSGTCLGVVEMVTTSTKINYRPDLEIVCKALEAVDLRSSRSISTPGIKVGSTELYRSEVFLKILKILKSICQLYRLPLALTWAPCVKQGKEGCRHSDENYTFCVSTVDPACFAVDSKMLGFLEACSEHHLLKGEGIVGRAFSSNEPSFAVDITAFGKTEYPLSHHARIFDLQCGIAIPLTSSYSACADFVLEFFLPKDCKESDERSQLLNSLLGVMHQALRDSQFVTGKELREVVASLPSDKNILQEENYGSRISPRVKGASEDSLWIPNMRQTKMKSKGVSVSIDLQKEPHEEFKLMTQWENNSHTEVQLNHDPIFHSPWQNPESNNSLQGGNGSLSLGGSHYSESSRRMGERRCTKPERTISLDVLRQYFAGSLKDAAKSLGVCPTTLKRICRQHGINRWPSRKIKKVGHSLKKLQCVIDSVHGAKGAIQLDSFYASFPELGPSLSGGSLAISLQKRSLPNNPSSPNANRNMSNNPQPPFSQEENGILNSRAAIASRSPSSCSQNSTSTTSCSTGAKFDSKIMNPTGGSVLSFNNGEVLKRPHSAVELHVLRQEESKPKKKLMLRSQSHKLFGESISLHEAPEPPNLPRSAGAQNILKPVDDTHLRVKATYGEDKIRFTLQPSWGFHDLQREIARRFSIDDFSMIDLKYLDDDHEWVLLTCDADLEECVDVYTTSSQGHIIRISLHQALKPDLNHSLGSSGQSHFHGRFL